MKKIISKKEIDFLQKKYDAASIIKKTILKHIKKNQIIRLLNNSPHSTLNCYIKAEKIRSARHWIEANLELNSTKKEAAKALLFKITKNEKKQNNAILEYTINELIKIIGSANITDETNAPLLYYSIMENNPPLTKILLEKNADPTFRFEDKSTPLHYARNIEIINLLLTYGADIEAEDEDEKTPLVWLTWNGSLEAFQYLVKKGAKLNDCFFSAIIYHRLDIIKWLVIEKKVSINSKDRNNNTILHHVECYRDTPLQPLFDLGAKVNEKNDDGYTPMDIYLSKQFSPMIIISLIENGAILTENNLEIIKSSEDLNIFKNKINSRIKKLEKENANNLTILKKRSIGLAAKKELKYFTIYKNLTTAKNLIGLN